MVPRILFSVQIRPQGSHIAVFENEPLGKTAEGVRLGVSTLLYQGYEYIEISIKDSINTKIHAHTPWEADEDEETQWCASGFSDSITGIARRSKLL